MKRSKGMLFLVVVMLIISLMCLSMGATYAFIYQAKPSSSRYNVNTSNLDFDVNYTYSNKTVYIKNDNDGVSSDSFGTVKITNKSDYNSYFKLSFSYATSELLTESGKSSIDDFGTYEIIPMEYVKVAVFGYGTNGKFTQLTDAINLGECPLIGADSAYENYQSYKYKVYEGLLPSSEYKTFIVKVWLDESIKNNPSYDLYDESLLYLKMDVDAEVYRSKVNGIFNGYVTYNGTPVDATITNLTTGESVAASASSNGIFTLNSLFENETYTIKANYNNKNYYTTVHLTYDDNSSRSIRSETTGTDSYQKLAYTYYTTVGQIARVNNIPLSSNSNKYTCSNCTIPEAYIYKISTDETISDDNALNLDLSNDGLDNGIIKIS